MTAKKSKQLTGVAIPQTALTDIPARKTITAKAQATVDNLRRVGVGIDPATIIAIITAIFQLFQGCKKPPAKAHQCCQLMARSKRWFVGRNILEEQYDLVLEEHGLAGNRLARAALLDTAADSTVPEVSAMYQESK